MNKSYINLENLLDEDKLSSRQERTIRRLVTYKLRYEDGKLILGYQLKDSPYQDGYVINEYSLVNIYKHLMFGLIKLKFQKHIMADTPLNKMINSHNQVKDIVEKDSGNHISQNPIQTKAQVLYGYVREIYG